MSSFLQKFPDALNDFRGERFVVLVEVRVFPRAREGQSLAQRLDLGAVGAPIDVDAERRLGVI